MNQKLIPIPLKSRWRDFRLAYLPALTFLIMVGVIAWMWSRYVQPSQITGEVEPLRANVISFTPVAIKGLHVDRFQRVTNGQQLVVVAQLESAQMDAELKAMEADLMLAKARLDIDRARNIDDRTRLRLQTLNERLNLTLARIRLQQAENEFERINRLRDQGVVAIGMPVAPQNNSGARFDFGYDVALRDRDTLRAEVEQRARLVADLDTDAAQDGTQGGTEAESVAVLIANAIRAQQARLESLRGVIILRSPMNGMVSAVYHRAGEKVMAGAPILTISSEHSDRIVAWVRQPVTQRPIVGRTVEIRRYAGLGQRRALGVILEVGGQLEPISPTLLGPSINPNRVEVGLPFFIRAPASLNLIPGETVQVSLKGSFR